MKLPTDYYLPEPSSEMADPMIGLPDLRKGLHSILLGYLLSLGAVLMMAGVVCCVIFQAAGGRLSPKAAEGASTVLFAAALLLGLAGLGSLILIVRGKWLCLSSAPEQYHAKWMMFMSILCILAGPALNLGAFLVGDAKAVPRGRSRNDTATVLLQEIEKYEHGMPELDTRAYVELAGQIVGLLSGIFFVLFLRAVALCCGARGRVVLTELYLLFMGLLLSGVVVLFWKPSFMLARPRLLLALGGGWLFAGLWYFSLILSTAFGISSFLEAQTRKEANPDLAAPSRYGSELSFLD